MSTATADLTTRVDRIEFAASYDLWGAVAPAERDAAGLMLARRGACRVVGSRLTPGAEMLNRVLGATADDATDGSLARAIDVLRRAGCTCQVPVRDDTADGREVRRWLEDRGFVEGYAWMKFVHDPATAAAEVLPPKVRVRRAAPSERRRFGTILAAGFGLPAGIVVAGEAIVGRAGWHCYLAETDRGEPVGVGAMYVDGDVAWLGLGATLPTARRMGAQSALLRRRAEDARRLGCSLIVTETGERVDDRPSASYRNILRAGFTEHGLRRHLVTPPVR